MSLITALHTHDVRLVEVICSSGASCNELIDGATPMHIAVGIQSSHDYVLTNALLQYGGDPNIVSEDGLTPVHVAVIWNKTKILKLLLNNGGDPTIQDDEGEDAWDKSMNYRQIECQKILRKHLNEIRRPKQEKENSKHFISVFSQNIPVYEYQQQENTITNDRKLDQLDYSRLSTRSSVGNKSVNEFERAFVKPTLNLSTTQSYGENSELPCQDEAPIAPPRRKLKNRIPISHSEPTSLASTPTRKKGLFRKIRSVNESQSRSFDEVDSAHIKHKSAQSVDNPTHQSLFSPPSIRDRAADTEPTRWKKKSLKLKMARALRRCNSTPGKLVSFDTPDSPKPPQTSVVQQSTPTFTTKHPTSKTLTPSTKYTPLTIRQNSFTPRSCDCVTENGSVVSPCNIHHTTQHNQAHHKTKRLHSIGKILNKISPKKGKSEKSTKSPQVKSPPVKPPRTLQYQSPNSNTKMHAETSKAIRESGISENDVCLLTSGQAAIDITDPECCLITPVSKDKSANYKLVQSPIKLTSSRGKSRIVDKEQLDQITLGHAVFDCTSPDHPTVLNTLCECGSTRLDYTICEQELNEELERILLEDSSPAARKSLFTDSGNESQTHGNDENQKRIKNVVQISTQTQTEDNVFMAGSEEMCSLHLNPQISNLHAAEDCSKQVSPGSGTHVSISQDSGIELLPLNAIKHRWGDNPQPAERRNSTQSDSSFHTCNSESVDSQYSAELASLPTETDSLINKVTRMNISAPKRDNHSSEQINQRDGEHQDNGGTNKNEPDNDRNRHDSMSSVNSAASIAEFLYTDFETDITLCEHRLPTDLQDISMFTELNTTGALDGTLNATNEVFNMTSGALNLSWRANKSLSELVNEESETIPGSISSLTDEKLRRELEMFGIRPGPINRATKRLYQLRLNRIKRDPNLYTSDQSKNYYSVELRQYLIGHTSVDLMKITELEQKLVAQFDCDSTSGERQKWREGNSKMSFTYLLLDPRTTINLPARHNQLEMERPGSSFEIFLSSIFYVGKGKKTRPYQHFVDAIKNKNVEKSEKLTQIHQIWDEKFGVVSLHVFHNMIPVEAYTREACMVDSIGLKNLTNVATCNYYGLASTWSSRDRRLVGASFLRKAFQIYMIEGERQIRPSDIRSVSS